MHTLRISLASDSRITIEPVGDMPDDIWESVVDWWSIGRKLDPNIKKILVFYLYLKIFI